jgi:hypothetical protein
VIIECPKCKKDNEINFSNDLKCNHCHSEFSNNKYKKSGMAASAAFIIGVSGYHMVDKYIISENRYPLELESEILDQCRNGYQKPIFDTLYARKNKICICALSKTMNDISYSDYKAHKTEFSKSFNNNAMMCLK